MKSKNPSEPTNAKKPSPSKGGGAAAVPQTCTGCAARFPSKNELFKHLRITGGRCLGQDAYEDFLRYVVNHEKNLEKVAVLYGYLPSDHYLRTEDGRCADPATREGTTDTCSSTAKDGAHYGVRGGDHASALVVESIKHVSLGGQRQGKEGENGGGGGGGGGGPSPPSRSSQTTKVNRSYASNSRGGGDLLAQDAHTGAMTEVCCARAPPLISSRGGDEEASKLELQAWINDVNAALDGKVRRMKEEWLGKEEAGLGDPESKDRFPGSIRVFGRISISNKKFNAEVDVSSRRMEYLLPLDFLVPTLDGQSSPLGTNNNAIMLAGSDADDDGDDDHRGSTDRQLYFDSFLNFRAGNNPSKSEVFLRPAPNTLAYLYKVKKVMQSLTTHIIELDVNDQASVMEKEFHLKKRSKQKGRQKAKLSEKREEWKRKSSSSHEKVTNDDGVDKEAAAGHGDGDQPTEDAAAQSKKTKKTRHVLRRKRYHNFSPGALAHEFLTFRRLDRFYHRATIRFEQSEDKNIAQNRRPFVLLSLSGDMFLNGQVRSVIGLFVAVCRGIIDPDIVDCIFDEEYANLVPAPMAPRTGLYAAEASYISWEGKLRSILSARRCDAYENGFNDEALIGAVEEWAEQMRTEIARAWCQEGFIGEDGRLLSEKIWVDDYLEPWAKRARAQLVDYRRWKEAHKRAASSATDLTIAETLLPPLDSVDGTVPQLYEKVLRHLREADASGLWPTTTPKRQLVMVSTKEDGSATSKSLSAAHMKAKANKEERSSAYAFAEGQGGASGSFSIGAMPGEQCEQPKGNSLFPELMQAAFELEIALCPNREPSSTIAVNRNAQFRPHTDSGAGSGQSTSLIVGLGTYVGGELMVEGEKHDIRYNPIEFNGWTQRHWTLPFHGERYSLVWFTPKGL